MQLEARRRSPEKIPASWWTVYGFPLVVIGACIVTAAALRGRPGSSTTDFLAFYQSGRQFLAGTDPYFPFVSARGPNLNPPWIVLLMSQLCRAPLPVAVSLWWAFSFACLALTTAAIAKAVAPGHGVAIASAMLVTQASYSNIRLGQVAWPVMLLVTLAWLADRAHRPAVCGFVLGLAIAWKPFLILFVPYLLWRREWVALTTLFIALAAAFFIGLVAMGAAGWMSWLAALRHNVGWEAHLLNASLAGFVSRMSRASPLWPPRVVWSVLAGLLMLVSAWRLTTSRRVDVAWAAIPLLALLISPLGWIHYLPIAAGPLSAMVRTAPRPAIGLGVAGWLLVCNPLAWMLPTNESGLGMLLTIGSSYTWGIVLLVAAVLVAASRSSSMPNAPSTSV
jgi:hypothetical protein